MITIPDYLLYKEDLIQSLLIKAQKKTEEYKYSDYKFENEYYEALFKYADEVMKKIGEGIALELDVDLKKSRKVPIHTLIKIIEGNEEEILIHKSLFSKLKTKYKFFEKWLKKFKFNKGQALLPLRFKNKIKYNPETKRPLTNREWNHITNDIVNFLKDKIGSLEEEVVIRGALFGKLVRSMEEEQMASDDIKAMSWDNIEKKYGELPTTSAEARKKFHFNALEKNSLDWAQQHASEYLSIKDGKLRNTIVTTTRQAISDGISDGLSPRQLASELYWTTPEKRKKKAAGKEKYTNPNEWALDFRRIALTESKMAKQNGYLLATKAKEPKKKIYMVFAGRFNLKEKPEEACNRWLGETVLLIDEPRDNDRIKGDSFAKYCIWPGKDNIGRSKNNQWICIPIHPHCTHHWERVDPTLMEWDENIGKLVFKEAA